MTPRTSARALTREIYDELAENDARPEESRPDTPPAAIGPDLMPQVRALYEDSAVPVREIARLAGVTERTLYKYAQKYGWHPRYCWDDEHPCMTGRGWRAPDGFAPAHGAGGRFVRREDAGKPFAKGIKALDAAGRARAQAKCAEAAERARRAAQDAELARLSREHWRAFRLMNQCMDDLIRYRKKHPPDRRSSEVETTLIESIQCAVRAMRRARLSVEEFEATMEMASHAAPPAALA